MFNRPIGAISYQITRLPDIPSIDDADDAGVDRRLGGMERKARFLAADEEHVLADTSADRIHGDERATSRGAGRGQGLNQQQLHAFEVKVLAGGDDVADDSAELHGSTR